LPWGRLFRRLGERNSPKGSWIWRRTPAHPGRIVQSACLEPLSLSLTAAAKILGVTRQTLNNIVSGKSGISPEMAVRLTNAFGSTEETWLGM